MIFTGRVLDIIVSTKDNSFALALSAFNEAHSLVIGAKESEIRVLKLQVEDLAGQLKYEKSRGDALVDRLLQKEAHVAAVAPLAAHVARKQDEDAVAGMSKIKVIFDELNSVSDSIPPPRGEGRAFTMAGGTAVAA